MKVRLYNDEHMIVDIEETIKPNGFEILIGIDKSVIENRMFFLLEQLKFFVDNMALYTTIRDDIEKD